MHCYVHLLFTCVKGISTIHSVDWRSLTFAGERHEIALRIPPPAARKIANRLCAGLGDAAFAITGVTVADIAVAEGPTKSPDGALTLTIEALTISDD